MSVLELRLLGPPTVTLDGARVSWARRKATALLAYLAASEQAQRRESLVNLLWPELPYAGGRKVLRQVLYTLNKELSRGSWLVVAQDTIELCDGPGLRIDVREFHSCLAECREHGHRTAEICDRCREPLERAAALFSGTFLSGFSLKDSINFDDWQLVQDENLRLELDQVLDRLVRSCSGQGAYTDAIDHARRWVGLDRLNESAHRALMQLYVMNGQRPAALRQYQECETVLREEVDAEPEQTTRELLEQIRSDRIQPQPEVRRFAIPRPARLRAHIGEMVGREQSVAQISALVGRNRLVSLVGPGGVGKTRLALRVAEEASDRFSNGVFIVPLETVADPALVPQAMATCMELPEVAGEERADTVCRALASTHALAILDNFEQVISAGSFVARLLRECTNLTVVTTSREPLGIEGEQEFPVEPLTEEEAAELFLTRARTARPGFSPGPGERHVVDEICTRLDRLPLAIELAAARVKLLTPAQLSYRLERVLSVPTQRRDVPMRHRTTDETVRWSYDLLTRDERTYFVRLAVFSGGFSLDAAESICAAGLRSDPQALIESLLAKSMIQPADAAGPAPRFRMLETVRRFALERLNEEPDVAEIRESHAVFYQKLAERLGDARTPTRDDGFRELGVDYDNVRAALQWGAAGGRAEVGHRIVGSLIWFWGNQDLISEGLAWARRYLSFTEDQETTVLARTHLAAGQTALVGGKYDEAREQLNAAATLANESGNREVEAWALKWACIMDFANPELHDAVAERLERSMALFKELNLAIGISSVTVDYGELLRCRGNYEAAMAAYVEARDRAGESGFPISPQLECNIGECHLLLGNRPAAAEAFRKALRIAVDRDLPPSFVAPVIESLLSVADDPVRAARLLGACEVALEDAGTTVAPADIAFRDEVTEGIRSRIGGETFDRNVAAGRLLAFDDAVREALDI